MRGKTLKMCGAALAVGGVALIGGELRAVGSIDVSGAMLQPGLAPMLGLVTIDAAANLGHAPDIGEMSDPESRPEAPQDSAHDGGTFEGLGGPDFHATADMTLAGGTYDFNRFTVDRGVRLTFSGPAMVRAAGDVRIDGRIEFADPWNCQLQCGGDLTIVGHDDPVTTGIYAPQGDAWIYVAVEGDIDISADSGATVELGAVNHTMTNEQVWFHCDGHGKQRIASAVLDGVGFEVAGDLDLTGCTGRRAALVAHDGAVTVHGGSLAGAAVVAQDDVVLQDATIGWIAAESSRGGVTIEGVSIVGEGVDGGLGGARLEAKGDVTTDDTSRLAGPGLLAWSSHGKVVLGAGTDIQVPAPDVPHVGGAIGWQVYGWDGVEVGGTLAAGAQWNQLIAWHGDVVVRSGAVFDVPDGEIQLWAQGSVTASGGSAALSAKSWDIRSVTGDLDLDVATMDAVGGGIVALTNGVVRLRGTYSAARDFQILSRRDAVDVSGATLRTTDVAATMSGFVRLATYASTATIDSSDATVTTGASDVRSGDILLQIAESGEEVVNARLAVARVDSRRTAAGVETRVVGTIVSPRLPIADLNGSSQVTGGKVSQRVFLSRKGSAFRGRHGRTEVTVTKASRRTARFEMKVVEASSAKGEHASVAFDRAGLHAKGTFRRPRVR